jgi:hypothetical protein
MWEEVLDLAPRDFRQIGIVPDVGVALHKPRNRHGDNLLVTAPLVRHLQHADRPDRNDRAWSDRPGIGDKYVARIFPPIGTSMIAFTSSGGFLPIETYSRFIDRSWLGICAAAAETSRCRSCCFG